jgi:hypothetical protein
MLDNQKTILEAIGRPVVPINDSEDFSLSDVDESHEVQNFSSSRRSLTLRAMQKYGSNIFYEKKLKMMKNIKGAIDPSIVGISKKNLECLLESFVE